MDLFSLEHGRRAYFADFAVHGCAALGFGALLLWDGPRGRWPELGALALAGLAGWTLAEYGVHRFVLHGLHPFRRWHAQHHLRPTALIYTPTIVSAAAIGLLVFAPAMLLADRWAACALTVGVVVGSLAYAITHHATHHWHARTRWLLQRKRWHALHHFAGDSRRPGRYGVTSGFWDHVLGSTRPAGVARVGQDEPARNG
jgi:sterol desaturase/sphingolipid hydroxylase (fatty acid hydroxylase superfamily)